MDPLSPLPEDVSSQIFILLGGKYVINVISLVSKSWLEIASSDPLWISFIIQRWVPISNPPPITNNTKSLTFNKWKCEYISRISLYKSSNDSSSIKFNLEIQQSPSEELSLTNYVYLHPTDYGLLPVNFLTPPITAVDDKTDFVYISVSPYNHIFIARFVFAGSLDCIN